MIDEVKSWIEVMLKVAKFVFEVVKFKKNDKSHR
ncbi:hypothetical protein SAMN05421737_104184 [Shouchella lonarensis]|uniref:Uncharacterized protein n=1 Tax=Shouchella lonarensis TaxID=1464122 RepID=A0A1G6HVG0_9BACI|nr:hypothetical protein SAMN05421737_104184 [Shouchella lonarensis]